MGKSRVFDELTSADEAVESCNPDVEGNQSSARPV